jgi:tetratricopeptide (TPR) repeat protein
MNKKISILIIAALLGIFSGCTKYLDLEPSQNISENLALTSDKNVKSVLTGAYAEFALNWIYGGNLIRNAELLGGNGEIQWVGTYVDPRQIFNKTMISTNEDVSRQWIDSYAVINTVNNILSALSVVKEADRNRVEGEALFLRSLMYFDLVRFFGDQYNFGAANTQLGVPLVLTPTNGINEGSYVTRNTVDEVYNKVIEDLINAASKLPADNDVYASKGAANALLARVYLQKGDYAKAEELFGSMATATSESKFGLGILATKKGEYDKAVNFFGSEPSYDLALALVLKKDVNKAKVILDGLKVPEQNGKPSYLRAVVGARLDDRTYMLNNLREAIGLKADWKAYAKTDLEFAKYFTDDTFKSAIQ